MAEREIEIFVRETNTVVTRTRIESLRAWTYIFARDWDNIRLGWRFPAENVMTEQKEKAGT